MKISKFQRMYRSITTLILLLCAVLANAQNVYIPDANFRQWINSQYPGAIVGFSLDTSHIGVKTDTAVLIVISPPDPNWQINNFDGIQYFKNCKYFWNYGTGNLTSLPQLPPKLKTLHLTFDALTSFPPIPNTVTSIILEASQYNFLNIIYPPNLKSLRISHGNLNSIPTLPNTLLSLHLNSNNNLSTVPTLPSSLLGLTVNGCNSVSQIPMLPQSLLNLECSWNPLLDSLPTLPDSLQVLKAHNNQLVALPELPNTLEWIDVKINQIDSLPTLPDSLRRLYCGHNNIGNMPQLPPKLRHFECYHNEIPSIPNFPTDITQIKCEHNLLDSLPPLPPGLTDLFCQNNSLIELPPFPNSLRYLICSNNNLTTLPSFSTWLSYLDCSFNSIDTLPPLNLGNQLTSIYCDSNQLIMLPEMPTTLKSLHCASNRLTSLPEFSWQLNDLDCSSNPLNCIPYLNNGIKVNCQNTNITCFPNHPNNYSSQSATPLLPLCGISKPCTYFNIGGKTYLDSIPNNTIDASERFLTGRELVIEPNHVLTNSVNGVWAHTAELQTQHVIKANSSQNKYHLAVPDSHVITPYIGTKDSTLHFGFQSVGNINDLEIDLIPMTRARPGFPLIIRIPYQNEGTLSQTPTIEFNYNDTALQIQSISVPYTNPSTGLLIFNLNRLLPLIEDHINLVFTVRQNVTLGTLLNLSSVIRPLIADSTPANNSKNLTVLVSGSYDPNDKVVDKEELSLLDVANKVWLEFTIRFQNTGSASAVNIVLTDSISPLLDWNTFQFKSSSHRSKWLLKDGSLSVRYQNIYLPDSAANKEKSHGYFRYRLRVKDNLSVLDTVRNFTKIYFDFNAPIITNTTKSFIALTSGEAELNTIPLLVYPNPTSEHIILYFSQGMSASTQVNIFDITGKLVQENKLDGSLNPSQINISVNQLNSGLYFLELLTMDGPHFARFIVR